MFQQCVVNKTLYLRCFCHENMVSVPQIAFFVGFAEFVPTARFFTICWPFEGNFF